jgi:hypothetical protein
LNVLYFESCQSADPRAGHGGELDEQPKFHTHIACIGDESQYDRFVQNQVSRFLGIGDRG